MPEHHIIVLGAGPAGLAAAVACRDQGQRALILDRGPPLEERDRDDPKTTACGVGGAGLYSDGKFSFFPSATAVWRLDPRRDLSAAYAWVGALLQRHGLPLPASLRDLPEAHVREESPTFSCKTYPSFYVPLLARQSMIAELLGMFPILSAFLSAVGLANALVAGCIRHWLIRGARLLPGSIHCITRRFLKISAC